MMGRFGPGPVFAYETLAASRRWQVYAARSGFVVILLIGLASVWESSGLAGQNGQKVALHEQLAGLGEGFFYTVCSVQITLILLAAPAATAGSICVDRSRGTLLHMMVTDLSDAEIVLGKLGGRLAPIFGLVACVLPVAALAGLLGGIDFGALAGSFAVALCLAVLGSSLALAISVRAKKTHEVLMAVYAIEGFWIISAPIWWLLANQLGVVADPPDFFWKANPYVIALNPYSDPTTVTPYDLPTFAGATLGLSALLIAWSIRALRRAVTDSEKPPKAARWQVPWRRFFPSLPNPTLDGNPVLWREWHRDRPSRLTRWVWRGTLGVGWALAGFGVYAILEEGASNNSEMVAVALVVQVGFGLLMIAASAPTALSEERMRGSLDILLSTPLSTRSIVGAKWRGGFRKLLVLLVLPLLASILVAGSMPETAPNNAAAFAVAVPLPAGTVIAPMPPGAYVVQTAPGTFVTYVPPGTTVPLPTGGTFVATATPTAAVPGPKLKPIPITVGERLMTVGLTVADVAASGAAIVSLGLLLATWIKRLGRAVAASVIAYLFMTIGWLVLMEVAESLLNPVTLGPGGQYVQNESAWWITASASLSPAYGCVAPMETLNPTAVEPRSHDWLGMALMVAIKVAFAALAFELTVRTFDRALGRVVESRPAALVKAQAKRVRRSRAAGLVTPAAS